MKRMLAMAALAVIASSMLHLGQAEARRFGGGASFGYHRLIPHAPSGAYRSRPMFGPRTGGMPRRGIMGAVAGLAFGGLLGSLLFGSAFHGINLFDMLILGGILLLILTIMRRKAGPMAYAAQPFSGMQGMQAQYRGFTGATDAPPSQLPPSIDRERFLTSAKQIFVRMQAAWDAKDIADIRRFCTPDIASRIEADMASLGEGRALTEVAMLNAELADVWPESGYEWAAVSFDAMLREQSLDAAGALTEDIRHEVREYWIFRHDPRLEDSTWFLAGIQQAA